jgi:hypothetical protein
MIPFSQLDRRRLRLPFYAPPFLKPKLKDLEFFQDSCAGKIFHKDWVELSDAQREQVSIHIIAKLKHPTYDSLGISCNCRFLRKRKRRSERVCTNSPLDVQSF